MDFCSDCTFPCSYIITYLPIKVNGENTKYCVILQISSQYLVSRHQICALLSKNFGLVFFCPKITYIEIFSIKKQKREPPSAALAPNRKPRPFEFVSVFRFSFSFCCFYKVPSEPRPPRLSELSDGWFKALARKPLFFIFHHRIKRLHIGRLLIGAVIGHVYRKRYVIFYGKYLNAGRDLLQLL